MSIERDYRRAKEILRGKARKDLKKYISRGEMIGRQGKKFIAIPVPNILPPRFRFGSNRGGVGMGQGQPGDIIGRGPGDQDGSGEAGDQPGGHLYEITERDIAEWLSEELSLPFLLPKDAKKLLVSEGHRYGSERRIGPSSLLKRPVTFLRSLRRSLSELDPDLLDELLNNPDFDPSPYITLYPEDRRYHAAIPVTQAITNCLIIFVMDVSGSMTDDQKDLVRDMSWWIKIWLKAQYDGILFRYIIHDAVAKEVNEDTFFNTTESGGTRISSAYHVVRMILDSNSGYTCPYGDAINSDDFNVYVFQFTDGDNWGEDNASCVKMLDDLIMPHLTMLGYVQVKSPYGSGDFISVINNMRDRYKNIIACEVKNRDGILDGLKALFSKPSNKKGG